MPPVCFSAVNWSRQHDSVAFRFIATNIVSAHITQASDDKQEIVPTLEKLGELPEQLGKIDALLVDTGYFS